MNLKTTLENLFTKQAALDLGQLVDAMIMAQAAPWLAESIRPLADDLRAQIPGLELAATEARAAAEQAQRQADEAARLASEAGVNPDPALVQGRLGKIQQAQDAWGRATAAGSSLKEAQSLLAAYDRVLTALAGVSPPAAEQVRQIVTSRGGIRPNLFN